MQTWSLRTALAVLAFGVVSAFGASPAHALCSTVAEEGSWRAADPNTRSITRAQIDFVCHDNRACPVDGPCAPPAPSFYIELFGACTPTDCPFGRVPARREGEWIRAYYNHGFALRDVWIRAYPEYPGFIRVYIYTDFIDPARPDYASDEWLVR